MVKLAFHLLEPWVGSFAFLSCRMQFIPVFRHIELKFAKIQSIFVLIKITKKQNLDVTSGYSARSLLRFILQL